MQRNLPPDALSTTADMAGAHGGRHMKEPPPSSSPSPNLNQLSQSQNTSIAARSERSIGPEHDLKNVPSHIEAQSGGEIQLPTPQVNHSPDQSSIAPNPLGKLACTSDSLILPSSQGRVHPCAHQEGHRLLLPDRVDKAFEDDTSLPPQPLNVVKGNSNNLESDKGFPDSVPEERNSVTPHSSSQSPLTNSAQCVHALNTSQTGFPTTEHKSHLSPSTILTKKHSPLSNPASHPAQQSALHEESLDSEMSYDDDDARSDVTYQSSTSASTTHTRANHLELPLSVPTHPPPHHSQPPTTLPNHSVSVSSHMEPAKAQLPPSEVPSMIDKSAETYPFATTVVEAAPEADASAVPSSSGLEQLVAVSSGEGCPPVLSTLENMYRQDSGYSGSHHFVSSNILHRHPDSMEPSDRVPMDSYQREQDSEGI